MERYAHRISAWACASCIMALAIRQYRIGANITWDDTEACMDAIMAGHRCKWAPAVIEVLRGVLALTGLGYLVNLWHYFRAHESLEEEALADPLHTRSALERSTFYAAYALEMLLLMPWNPPLSNYRLHTEGAQPGGTLEDGHADASALELWHADDVGGIVGLLRALGCLRSLKHILWRKGSVPAATPPDGRRTPPRAGSGTKVPQGAGSLCTRPLGGPSC